MLTPLKIQSLATGVNLVDTPPVIVTQPESSSGFVGSTVSFTVEAIGKIPLSYQWYKDGEAISGANNSTMSLSGLLPSDQGVYTAQVSNALGSTTSQPAVLTVLASPFRPGDLPEHLVGWWRFDEASGLRADSSINANHLTEDHLIGSLNENPWGTSEPSIDFEASTRDRVSIDEAFSTELNIYGPSATLTAAGTVFNFR